MLPSVQTLSVDTPVGCLMIDGEAVRQLMETGAFAPMPVRARQIFVCVLCFRWGRRQ
jgi:hypothetical protein